ncbi:MAG: hypothetical protein MI861_02265, partial [Pirellulales bacterium]|nr:hypothetical protein [Pirellulales bacterium]
MFRLGEQIVDHVRFVHCGDAWRIRWLFVAVLPTLALFISPACGQELDHPSEDTAFNSDYAASLLKALLLNNESIDRYDVLFSREVLTIKPSGDVNSYKSRYRLCRDSDQKSWLAACAVQSDDWAGDSDAVSSKRVFGLLVTPDGEAYLRNSSGIHQVPKEKVPKAPGYIGWPSFSTLGLDKFPSTSKVYSSSNEFWDRVQLGQHDLASKALPD